MDRNALLAATRAEFLEAFLQAADHAMALAKVATFRKAEFSFSAAEQRSLIDAHRVLQDRQPELRVHLQRTMEQLLNRSFQTTYSTFRPSFSTEVNSDTLSLVDASQFEDQLRVDEITNRFRNAADQQLRDLNIRIALLFEQTTIKERENPFRPWLFTRCLAAALEDMGVRSELGSLISVQLAGQLEESVAVIYGRVNGFLAANGIAAQLQLKARRPPGVGPALAGGRAEVGDATPSAAAINGGLGSFSDTLQRSGPTRGYTPQGAASPAADGLDAAAAAARMEAMMERVRRLAGITPDGAGVQADAQTAGSQGPRFQAADRGAGTGPAAPSGEPQVTAAAPASGGGWLSRNRVGETMRRFFAGDSAMNIFGTSAPDARIEPRLGSPVDRAVSPPLAQSLQRLLDSQPPVSADDPSQGMRNLIAEQRTALAGATGDVSEQMTIDVVAMLFEFILRDSQIPAEVRAQLGRLQFLVLKLALRESTLLTQKGHPARMLVNRIGSISIGLRQLDPSGARISTEISRIVESLLSGDTSSSTPFLAMLDRFDLFIANEFRAGDAQVGLAVQVIGDAQSRTLRFTHLSAQLNEALFGVALDAFLRDFLMTSWTYVMERAERRPDARSGTFRRLVPDLLWSIVPRADARHHAELFSLLPTIVRTIREGLSLIEWDASRQQPVLDWLVQAHRSVLRGGGDGAPAPTLASLRAHFETFVQGAGNDAPDLPSAVPDAAHQQVFLDQAIREADGAMQSIGAGGTEPDAAPDGGVPASTDAGTDARSAEAAEAAMLAQLRAGVAVRVKLGDGESNAQLTWMDPKRSNLMLLLDGQAAPALISMRTFRRMLANGRLRFLETAPLFERAIASVQQSAESL